MNLADECNRLRKLNAELAAALSRLRTAFFVDGKARALRAAFEGTQELVRSAERERSEPYEPR